jgi:hypothetical protein
MRQWTDESEGREPAISRRGLLAGIGTGTVATVAGCSGGGGGSDGNPTEGEPTGGGSGSGGDSTVANLCRPIPGESVAYDAGATPVVCDFDVPAPLADSFGTGVGEFVHQGYLRSEASGYGELSLQVQEMNDEGLVGEEPSSANGREVAVEVEFDGETVPFYATREQVSPASDRLAFAKYSGSLPHTVGSKRLYFPVVVRTELDVPDPVPDECRTAVEEVTARTTESIRPNPETAVAQRIRDQWDDPP